MIAAFRRFILSWFGDHNEEVVIEHDIVNENNKRPLPELNDEVEHSLEHHCKRQKRVYEPVNGLIEAPQTSSNTSYSSTNDHKSNGVDTLRPENRYQPKKPTMEKPNPNHHTPVFRTPRAKYLPKENASRRSCCQLSLPDLNPNRSSALSDLRKMREKIAYDTLIKSQYNILSEYNKTKLTEPTMIDLTKDLNERNGISKENVNINNSTELQNAEPSYNPTTSNIIIRKTMKSPTTTAHTEWIHDLNKHFNQMAIQRKLKIQDEEIKARIFHENNKIFDKILEERLLSQIKVKEVIELEEPGSDEEEEVDTVLPVFTEEEEKRISRAMTSPPHQKFSEKFRLTITGDCLATLKGLTWLNDNVINFYMSLITQRSEESGKFKVFTLNTFFCVTLKARGYSAVRRWTKKVDIFSCDLVPIPVHVNKVHWCMLIIDFRMKAINYYDSMGGTNNQILDLIEDYLKEESLDKRKTKLDFSGWKKVCVKDIPQQMNGCDCGVFSCMFAEYITRGAKLNFKQEQMPYFRRKICLEILLGKLLT